MSVFQATREQIVETLSEAFSEFGDGGITFQSGELDVATGNFDTGCVFKARDQPDSRDNNQQQQHFVVRVLLRDLSAQQPSPEFALDPTPLEDASDLIIATLRGIQQTPSGYFVWVRTDYHTATRVCDVLFHTWEPSLFNTGG